MVETTKTLKERITEFLQSLGDSIAQSFFWGDEDEELILEKLPNVKHNLEERHGGEGEGDSYWTVYSFADDTDKVYVQFDGYYSSYGGSEYEEWFFVEPREVMVTQYFKI